MGLAIDHFIASCNINHPFVDYLITGKYTPSPSLRTLTNAMDVGNPSNFPRLLSLYEGDHKRINQEISGFWFDDESTKSGMRELQTDFGYTADPHGAVGYLGLKKYLEVSDSDGIFLGTAHPVKFAPDVEAATGTKIELPDSLAGIMSSVKKSVKISSRYEEFRDILLHSSGN
jgi:threonine synthase